MVRPFKSGISAYNPDPETAIREAVELAGGMPWLERGDRVLIKPALNSQSGYPFTSSPASCAALVRYCLELGAGMVVVADETGLESTFPTEPLSGGYRGREKDQTVLAFKETGIYDAVMSVAEEMDARHRVSVTSFREHGWRKVKLAERRAGNAGGFSPYRSNLRESWLAEQLELAETVDGKSSYPFEVRRIFHGRHRTQTPGLYVPELVLESDHIINCYRLATHIMSHFTMATKNWVGTMRPDQRLWMHQLSYVKNVRHRKLGLRDDHPIRTEPLYHEFLADLHLPCAGKERLCVADAGKIVLTGGPNRSDRQVLETNLAMAATDIVSADVVGLAILRYGTIVAEEGLKREYGPQPSGWSELISEYLRSACCPGDKHLFRGTDSKLCDESFSNWDWVALQRARELSLGPGGPDELSLVISGAVNDEKRKWIEADAFRKPIFPVKVLAGSV